MIDHVISLAEMGYRLFPLLPGRKHPNGVLVPNGRNDATSDIERIRAWHKRYPMSNWGLVTDGLVVVDVDGENNLWPVDPDMCADLAGAGAIAVTGRGGRHYFFKQPHGMELKSTTGKLGDHVDTRGLEVCGVARFNPDRGWWGSRGLSMGGRVRIVHPGRHVAGAPAMVG